MRTEGENGPFSADPPPLKLWEDTELSVGRKADKPKGGTIDGGELTNFYFF